MKKIFLCLTAITALLATSIWLRVNRNHNSSLGESEQQSLRDAPNDGTSGDLPADFSALKTHIRSQSQALNQNVAAEKAARATNNSQLLAAQFDPNVSTPTRIQLLNDMAFVQGLKGNGVSALHEKIFGPVAGPAYLRFFNSRVKAVGLDEQDTAPGEMAYVSESPRMWLTPNYVHYNMAQIVRVQIVFHESRHTESEHHYWPHVNCPVPFLDDDGKDVRGIITGTLLAGLEACDTTPIGAYGIELIMAKNIQKYCTTCTDKVKMDAGLYADDTLKRIINPAAKQAIREDLYQ
jgi:hypothetical protein